MSIFNLHSTNLWSLLNLTIFIDNKVTVNNNLYDLINIYAPNVAYEREIFFKILFQTIHSLNIDTIYIY